MIASLVFALATIALLLQDGSLPHLHDDPCPAFYNHDHDLSLLATLAGGAARPDGTPLVTFLPLVAAALPAIVSQAAPAPLRYSASRAPPRAS